MRVCAPPLTRSGRVCVLRARAAIYPIVREAHLAEPDTEAGARIRVANEQLVELFYLSAEAVGDAPSEGAGAGAAEASKSKEVDEEEEPRVEEVD